MTAMNACNLMLAAMLVMSIVSGCAGFQPQTASANLQERIRKAYRQVDQPLPAGPYARQFERGWKQAYLDYARGSEGKLPSVPPGVHRIDRCSDHCEFRKLGTWYHGYEAGLLAAQNACGPNEAATVCRPEEPIRGGGYELDTFSASTIRSRTAQTDFQVITPGDAPLPVEVRPKSSSPADSSPVGRISSLIRTIQR